MKYRYLTYEEFTVVEDDFSNYLYDCGLSPYEWKLLQDQYSEQAWSMLGEYSDLVFDRMVKDVRYLEYRSEKRLKAIECHKDYMVSIGVEIPESSKLNLTDIGSLLNIDRVDQHAYKCFEFIVSYHKDRDHQIFDMIEEGCYVVDSSVFNKLKILRTSYQN